MALDYRVEHLDNLKAIPLGFCFIIRFLAILSVKVLAIYWNRQGAAQENNKYNWKVFTGPLCSTCFH